MSLSYDTALKLKEGGYPQGSYQRIFDEVKEHPERVAAYVADLGIKSLDELAYRPTLEELIEACGEDFGYLSQGDKGHWFAYPKNLENLDIFISQPTPSEAVENLYLRLALNKKV